MIGPMWFVKESDAWLVPYKDEGSIILKMKFMTSNGALQVAEGPMISTNE